MKLDFYDLDKLETRVFNWVDSVKIFNYVDTVGLDEQIKAVIDELKAAREFIEFARYYEEPHWHEYGRLLQNYDEATK